MGLAGSMVPLLTAIQWLRLFGWFRLPFRWWVQAKTMPKDPLKEAGIDPSRPVCFVTPTGSLSDLIVIDEQCRRLGLPRPRYQASALRDGAVPRSGAVHMFLSSLRLFQADRESRKEILHPLTRMVENARAKPDFNIQLVPVSVFWGRNPGKSEQSIMKLLFFDDEHAGVIQKFFIVLVQGRNVLVQFGKPINLQEQVASGESADQVARKLSRVMRVYFKTQRFLSVGPNLTEKPRVVETIVRTKPVRGLIDDEVRRSGQAVAKVENEARKYAFEIAADPSYPFVRAAEILLKYLWQKMFTGLVIRGIERVRDIGANHEVIYMPSHRSHIDYLLLGQSLYSEGYVVPHTAAGINLNFWPVGGILRKIGAFYIRRTFSGNKLYAAVFSEYVHHLVTSGFPIKFFPEGGRSRTGKLLPPKTGFLSMVIQSFLRNSDRSIALVPIFLGYDRVWEAKTYVKETRGEKKRAESIGQLLSAVGDLRKTFGSAYVSCGEPIDLKDFLNVRRPGWKAEVENSESRPPWVNPTTQEVAIEIMNRINAAAVLGPVSLVATALLAVPNRALAEDQLCDLLDAMLKMQRLAPFSATVFIPGIDGRAAIAAAERVEACRRLNLPGGDVIYCDEEDAKALSYYNNMTAHLFLLPAIVARVFQHCDQMTAGDVLDALVGAVPFVRNEYFLGIDDNAIPAYASSVVSAMVTAGFVEVPGQRVPGRIDPDEIVCRPGLSSNRFLWLQSLSRVCAGSLDRVGVGLAMLGAAGAPRALRRQEFETAFAATGRRLDTLRGSDASGAFDGPQLRTFVDVLVRSGLAELQEVQADAFNPDEGAANAATVQQIVGLPALRRVATLPRLLLGTDMSQSIGRSPV